MKLTSLPFPDRRVIYTRTRIGRRCTLVIASDLLTEELLDVDEELDPPRGDDEFARRRVAPSDMTGHPAPTLRSQRALEPHG